MKRIGREDPGFIVVDEMAGQLLALAAAPLSIEAYAAAFVAFRVFDVFKLWPANWADDRLTGGFGAMSDDMIAGAYAALALLAASAAGVW